MHIYTYTSSAVCDPRQPHTSSATHEPATYELGRIDPIHVETRCARSWPHIAHEPSRTRTYFVAIYDMCDL